MKFVMQNCICFSVDRVVRVVSANEIHSMNMVMHKSRIYLDDGTHIDSPNTVDYIMQMLNENTQI